MNDQIRKKQQLPTSLARSLVTDISQGRVENSSLHRLSLIHNCANLLEHESVIFDS